MLPDGVVQQFFSEKMVSFYACVHGRRKEFLHGGHQWIFPNVFLRGAKSGEICFLPLEIRKTAFSAEIFKFLPSFRRPCLCVGKSSCHTTKNWCNFKLKNLISKLKKI